MRPNLPVTVVEKLLTQVSENFRSHLLDRTDLSPEVASALLIQARELAVLGLSASDTGLAELIEHLARNKRLTPSIILRALCMGDLSFFAASLAKAGQYLARKRPEADSRQRQARLRGALPEGRIAARPLSGDACRHRYLRDYRLRRRTQ